MPTQQSIHVQVSHENPWPLALPLLVLSVLPVMAIYKYHRATLTLADYQRSPGCAGVTALATSPPSIAGISPCRDVAATVIRKTETSGNNGHSDVYCKLVDHTILNIPMRSDDWRLVPVGSKPTVRIWRNKVRVLVYGRNLIPTINNPQSQVDDAIAGMKFGAFAFSLLILACISGAYRRRRLVRRLNEILAQGDSTGR